MASSARRTWVRLRLPADGRLAQEGRAAFHNPCLHDHEPQDPPEVGPRSTASSDLSSLLWFRSTQSWPLSSGSIRRFSSPNTTTSFASSVLLQHRMVSSQAAQAQPSQVAGSTMQSANETEEAAEKVGRKLSIGSQKTLGDDFDDNGDGEVVVEPTAEDCHLSIESLDEVEEKLARKKLTKRVSNVMRVYEFIRSAFRVAAYVGRGFASGVSGIRTMSQWS